MVHKLKCIVEKYRIRLRGIVRYIYDYKAILFSLIYIFFNTLFIKILRNNSDFEAMGRGYRIALLAYIIIMLLILLRNIAVRSNAHNRRGNRASFPVHFFTLIFLTILVASISICRVAPQMRKEFNSEIQAPSFTNSPVSFEAYITTTPVVKHLKQQVTVELLEDVDIGGNILSVNHGNILIKTDNYEKFSIGQVCKFSGILIEPESFLEFDYKTYLKNKQIFLIMEDPKFLCYELNKRRGGDICRNILVDMKNRIIFKIDTVLHEPQSSLLAGILFGENRLFSTSFEENVRVTGVSHVVAASGYNITILVVLINKVVFFLPRKAKIILGLIVIWSFALLSGLSSSIIRACIMSTFSLLALLYGRSNSIHISMPLASAVFVILKPLIIFDVGFLLSVSATLGLIYILPILISIKEKVTKKFKFLEEYLLPTMSCTLSTIPISLITFETFSLWSIPVNTMILPVIEGTMLWGALSILTSDIHKPLSYLLFTVVNLQLKYFEWIVNIIGELNIGSWEVTGLKATILSTFLIISIILFVIYLYPIDNEKYNHYLKD